MESNFITGQRALGRLLSDVKTGAVSHAYILEGPKGIGKRTAAEIFARALHCTGEEKPCGRCLACRRHLARTHPDVFFIEPEENGNIKIDAVRAAAEELYMRPRLSDRKILIIDGADGLVEPAQNALLKIFEEPPDYGTVVLLSENIQNLLPTIRSRGVKLLMEPFTGDKIRAFVEKKYPHMRDKSSFVAGYSGGVVGRAIDICEDEEFFGLRESLIDAVSRLTGGKDSILAAADAVCGGRKKLDAEHWRTCLDILLSWLGDAAVCKQGGRIVNTDHGDSLRAFAAKITAAGAAAAVDTVTETARGLNPSMKYDLWITNMFIKCWRDLHGYSSRS